MNNHPFSFHGHAFQALPSGALYWPAQNLLVVSDLHFGKSARVARFGGAQLPPYETTETLTRLAADLSDTKAKSVICLGDSFDTPSIHHNLPDADVLSLNALQAGLDWTWIEGNHDPGPVNLGGAHRADLSIDGITFRHIAQQNRPSAEVSGHYHPKATLQLRGRHITKPCFLYDTARLILPAYGAFTGGLRCHDPALSNLMAPSAKAILTGPKLVEIPMPRLAPLP